VHRREIAMLKSVGLTPAGFLRMLRYASLFYGLTALLYGLPLWISLSTVIYLQFDGVSTTHPEPQPDIAILVQLQ
jgi:putative ABC transport system permease protein